MRATNLVLHVAEEAADERCQVDHSGGLVLLKNRESGSTVAQVTLFAPQENPLLSRSFCCTSTLYKCLDRTADKASAASNEDHGARSCIAASTTSSCSVSHLCTEITQMNP